MFYLVWTRICIGSYLNCLRARLPPSLATPVLEKVKEKLPATIDEEMRRPGVAEKQCLRLSLCAAILHAVEAISDNIESTSEPPAHPATRQHVLAAAGNDMLLQKIPNALLMLQI
mmetsp:Transcript_21220/g.44834  ORF Transcript_21220/g.44834 Transcript_21220/m.44834 type:complete len:115 (+) Transcript_21220:485-829(+)